VNLVIRILGYGSLLVLAALLIAVAGGPISTDDLWWRLKLGEAFSANGPWLDIDPMLFSATDVPNPAAWIFDVAVFRLLSFGGFPALKVLHVLTTIAILALAWRLLLRASRSTIAASLATAAFAALVAYRTFQLRPHLFTILAVLILYALLMEKDEGPSPLRILAASVLCAVWANVHAGFLLGPILIGTAVAAACLATLVAGATADSTLRRRAARLIIALGATSLGTLANPRGAAAHLSYFLGGKSTPDLSVIRDEWAAFHPFQLPLIGSLPTPAAWTLEWILILFVLVFAGIEIAGWRRSPKPDKPKIDLVLLALAVAAIGASLIAVRFLWLGIFPLLLISKAWPSIQNDVTPRVRLGIAGVATLLVPLFIFTGDWALASKGLPKTWAGYSQDYNARQYYGHGVWFLKDAQISGNLFSDYFMGGFLGYWLTPEIQTFVNGSLNVPIDVMDAYTALRHRRGLEPGRDFLSLLDDREIDLFFGLGTPVTQGRNQPRRYTTTHLERSKGTWRLVFRNLRSSIYLRINDRNQSNLDRITKYYAGEKVPFDPDQGFDVERIIREAPSWAMKHGVIPHIFPRLVNQAARNRVKPLAQVSSHLAGIYGMLGLYERAANLDRQMLTVDQRQRTVRRHLIWCLLHLDQPAKALEEAAALEAIGDNDFLSAWMIRSTRDYASVEDQAIGDGQVALLPVFHQHQGSWVTRGYLSPEARE
jgi:hypothetical protein